MVDHIDTWPNANAHPDGQKKQKLYPSKLEEIKKEIEKVQKASFIYLIADTSWVSNPIPIMEKHGTIHVCTDF